MSIDLPVDIFTVRTGIRFIGYPAMGLVGLSLAVAPVSKDGAVGLLFMSLGYVCVGVGFTITLLWTDRVINT